MECHLAKISMSEKIILKLLLVGLARGAQSDWMTLCVSVSPVHFFVVPAGVNFPQVDSLTLSC